MDCHQALENLSAHLDNALDSTTREELQEHLHSCASCRSELDALRACVEAVSSMDRLSAPPGFLTEVHERLPKRSVWKRFPALLALPWKAKIPLHAAGVAAAFILIILLVPTRETTKEVFQPPEQPSSDISVETARPAQPPQLAQGAPQPSHLATGDAAPEGAPLVKEDRIIELVLLMEPSRHGTTGELEHSPRKAPQPAASITAGAAKTRPAPVPGSLDTRPPTAGARMREIHESSTNEKKPERARLQERERAAVHSPAESTPGEMDFLVPISQVEEIIRRVGGTVTGREVDPATGKPCSLLTHIPSAKYPSLIAMLQEKWRLRGAPSDVSLQEPGGMLLIRIRLDQTIK